MNTFPLSVLTPEKEFFTGRVVSLTVCLLEDEQYTILSAHAPMVAALPAGSFKIVFEDGEEKQAFNSEGFVKVSLEEVLLFTQACEWPEDIDVDRALASKKRAEERLLKQQSLFGHHSAQVSLTRALQRLRIKNDPRL